jgi:hypothetical protein
VPSTFRTFGPGSIVAMLLALSRLAVADDGAAPEPWSAGVSPEDRQAANASFEAAVTLHKQWLLTDAVTRYEQALEHWDHPQIRFHLARAQEKMGDIVAAHESLFQALRWGMDPFTPEEAVMAREMLQRLEASLARLEADCDEPGAQVFLDGKPWFACPGRGRAMLRPGEHAIIARKPGYFTLTRSVSLMPAKRATAEIRLSPETMIRRRWERWGPWKTWAVVGTSAALALAGGTLEWMAVRDIEAHDERFEQVCAGAGMCMPYAMDRRLTELRADARLEKHLAIGVFTAAGVTLAAGAMLGWLDRPSKHRNRDEGAVELEIAPLVTPGGAGVSLGGSF